MMANIIETPDPILRELVNELQIHFKPIGVAAADRNNRKSHTGAERDSCNGAYNYRAIRYVLDKPDFTIIAEDGIKQYKVWPGIPNRFVSEVVILPAGEIVFRHVKDEGVYTFKDGEWVRNIKDMYAQIYPDFAHLKHHI